MWIEVFLAALMVYYAPAPWIVILGHSIAIHTKKDSRPLLFVLWIIAWMLAAYFVYLSFGGLFTSRFFNPALKVVGSIFLLAAAFIEWRTRKELGTARILGSSEFKKGKDKLITTGIYSWARHPRHVEHPLWFLALGLIFGYYSLLWFSLYLFVALTIATYLEEKELVQRYGKAYIAYRKRTPAFFIPPK